MRFSGALTALVLLASGFGLAACASGGKAAAVPVAAASAAAPRPTPSPQTRASVTDPVTPTPRASATPFLSTPDEAGAFAFARAYFAELDRALATGDVTALALFREPVCPCIRAERDIARWYQSGIRVVGSHHTIEEIMAGAHGPLFYEVGVRYRGTAFTREEPGQQPVVTPPLHAVLVMDLIRHGPRWQLRDARIHLLEDS